MRPFALIVIVAAISAAGATRVQAEVLRCAVACAEMRALEENPPVGIPENATELERRRAQLKAADRAGADANARWYIAAQVSRYAGATVGGIEGRGWVGPALGATSEGLAHFSEVAMETYYERRVDHLGAAMDRQLDGLLLQDGKITADELKQYEERVVGLLYDRDFLKQFDGEMKEVFTDTQGRVNFDLLLKTFGTGKEIQGSVAELDKKADEAKRQLREVDRHVRNGFTTINNGMREGFTTLSLGQANISKQVDINRRLLETQLTPRQRLELANQGLVKVGADDYQRLVQVVQAQDIRAFQGDVRQAAQALRSMGLDPKTDAFVAQASSLMDAGLGLAAALTDPTGLSVATSVMGMVGVVRGFGRKSGPSAEAKLLKKVLEELYVMRKEMREFHAQQMEMLGKIRQDIFLMHKDMRERLKEINERLVYVQLGVQESLTQDVQLCFDIFNLTSSIPDRDRSLEDFRRWWERERLTQPYHTCTEGLTAVVNAWSGLNRNPSRAFVAVTDGPALNPAAINRASDANSFRKRVWAPTVAYTQHYLSMQSAQIQTQARSRIYTPSAQLKWEAAQAEAGDLASWSPPAQLPAATFIAPIGEDLFAPEPMLTVSSFVRAAGYISGLLYEENGTLRPITENVVRRQPQGYPERLRQLTTNMETHVRAALAQEHVLAGTPILDYAARVIDEQVIPLYYAARFERAWPALEKHLQQNKNDFTESCTTGDAVFDTLCVMQANPIFAENVLRAVMTRRVARSKAVSLQSYEFAVNGATTKALRDHTGDDVILSDAASPADFPSIRAAYTETPGSSWALELPRAFVRGEPAKNEESFKAPADPHLPAQCWSDPPVDFSLESEHNKERAQQIQRAWSRCYLLPAASTLDTGELRTRPVFAGLVDEIRLLRITRAYQIDPQDAPSGMRDLIEMAAWGQSNDVEALRLRESTCATCGK